MKIEIENFRDFTVVLERIAKDKIKDDKYREDIVLLLEKVFYIGFDLGKNGKAFLLLDEE